MLQKIILKIETELKHINLQLSKKNLDEIHKLKLLKRLNEIDSTINSNINKLNKVLNN